MRRLIAAVLISLATAYAQAADFGASAKGSSTAKFLALGAGARAAAMGEAYSAVADEASAVHWNPAALTRVAGRSATFMHSAYLDSSFYDYAAYAQSLGDSAAFGADLKYFSAGKIAETDVTGAPAGSFSPYDMALSVAYARKVAAWDGFSAGLAGKFVQSKIVDSATAFAVDAGILSPGLMGDALRLSFGVANLGTKMKFNQTSEELPLALRAGSSFKASDAWTMALDVGLPRDNGAFVALGTEYLLLKGRDLGFAGRAGFNSRTIGDVSGFSGVSFGLGLTQRQFGLDYALLPFGSLGLTHRVSLSAKF